MNKYIILTIKFITFFSYIDTKSIFMLILL